MCLKYCLPAYDSHLWLAVTFALIILINIQFVVTPCLLILIFLDLLEAIKRSHMSDDAFISWKDVLVTDHNTTY